MRGHPQPAAVAAAGWIGIASMGLLWPIAFIWAFLTPKPPASAGAGAYCRPVVHGPGIGRVARTDAGVHQFARSRLRTLQNQKG